MTMDEGSAAFYGAVLAAAIAALAALVSAGASYRGVRLQEQRESDRHKWETTHLPFVEWQMHKRKVYTELLAAICDAQVGTDRRRETSPKLEASLAAGALVAEQPLRQRLRANWRDISVPKLTDLMAEDVNTET